MRTVQRYAKPVVFVAALLPLALLLIKGFRDELGANPIEVITRSTGFWTLMFLTFTLAVTPVRKLTGLHWLIQLRRMLGLFAFFYGSLHLMTYVWLDKFFDVHEMLHDIGKRRFITVGMLAFALMVPLAITSTRKMIRRLGRRWQMLHRLVYASAAAGAIHFYWLVKRDVRRPVLYGSIIAILLFYRVVAQYVKARVPAQAPRRSAA